MSLLVDFFNIFHSFNIPFYIHCTTIIMVQMWHSTERSWWLPEWLSICGAWNTMFLPSFCLLSSSSSLSHSWSSLSAAKTLLTTPEVCSVFTSTLCALLGFNKSPADGHRMRRWVSVVLVPCSLWAVTQLQQSPSTCRTRWKVKEKRKK